MTIELHRRSLLRLTGTAILTGAIPRPVFAQATADSSISPVMTTLSNYMTDAANKALPDDIVEQTKLHILDTVGAMVSGTTLKPGKVVLDFARNYGGPPAATVIGSNITCGPIEAALANGVLAHSDETDDSSAASESHPGASVVPATLAASEHFDTDGVRFIRAVTLGYDVGARITLTIGTRENEVIGHKSNHAVVATFGSSAAAGCVAGFDPQKMRWLLDYAAQQSSGLASWQRDKDHIVKGFIYAGMGARNGVTSALLVQSGWTGIDDIFSGADNYLAAYGPQADPANLVDQLGSRFEVVRTTIKRWTTGSAIMGPLDALQLLMTENKLHADDMKEVIVRVAAREARVVSNRDLPDICLQHMIAVMMIDGTASFAAAHDVQRMQDAEVLRQRAKVNLIADEDLQKLLPRRESNVEVVLQDGRRFSHHIDAVRGSPENPMPRDEVAAKTRDLMAPVLGAEKCDALTKRILALEDVHSIRELRPLLQVG